MDIKDGVTEGKKTKKGASADCIFHMQKRKITTLKPVCLYMHRRRKKNNLEDSTDKDKSEERLLCYCSAADISAGRQMGN